MCIDSADDFRIVKCMEDMDGILSFADNVVGILRYCSQLAGINSWDECSIVSVGDLQPSNLVATSYMATDHGEILQIQLFFDLVSQNLSNMLHIDVWVQCDRCQEDRPRPLETDMDILPSKKDSQSTISGSNVDESMVDDDVRVIDNICEELYRDVQSFNEEMLLHGINDAIEETVTDRYMDSDPTLMNWMDNFLDDVDNGLDLTINGRKDCPDLEDLDEELCKLLDIKDSLPPNRDVIKGYGGIRDEFRRLKYGEMTFFGFMNNQFDVCSHKLISMYPKARHMVDEMNKNVLKQDIMYATALLTESYVFDDDSPSPVLKTISRNMYSEG